MSEDNKLDEDKRKNQELPEFTLKNVLLDIYNGVAALIFNPFCNRIVCPILIALTSIISKVIIALVPYTEIDFATYMQQIQLINDGEIDYTLIYGDTGPIVYPAGYVQIYQWINYLTNDGTEIPTAQSLFGYLFTLTTLLVVVTYTMTPDLRPWPLYLLIASKRLFSIYVLRLFNDCFTTICMVGVTIFLQQASYWYSTSSSISFWLTLVAADLFSIAISIKMNALLYLPAFIIISYFLVGENIIKLIVVLAIIPLIQILMGWKFLLPFFNDDEAKIIRWNYINQAFDFKRNFLYEWTVNWKFLDEEFFLSDKFSKGLLFGHISLLLFFFFTRFLNSKITKKSMTQLIIDSLKPFKTISPNNLLINHTTGPKLILLIMSTTNIIGVLFARSLHYQFLSWYCWQLPFLIYMTNWNILIGLSIWGLHEYCWNTFPSTNLSSGLFVSLLSIVLYGVWNNKEAWFKPEKPLVDDSKKNA